MTFRQEDSVHECCDPRNVWCRCFFPIFAVWAYQGCDSHCDIWAALCCHWLFTCCCWNFKKPQKRWKPLPQHENSCCCCYCHPKNACCRFCFPGLAVFAWQGCDNPVELLVAQFANMLVPCLSNIYACAIWKPQERQKIWGVETGTASVVGAPITVVNTYGAVPPHRLTTDTTRMRPTSNNPT
ncbi:unnamed protein product [Amoebophrya sp. A120]|nr:unnamed protein product [Amoebophrya sp. A120]|eukprot:GSA120T00008489001.1